MYLNSGNMCTSYQENWVNKIINAKYQNGLKHCPYGDTWYHDLLRPYHHGAITQGNFFLQTTWRQLTAQHEQGTLKKFKRHSSTCNSLSSGKSWEDWNVNEFPHWKFPLVLWPLNNSIWIMGIRSWKSFCF